MYIGKVTTDEHKVQTIQITVHSDKTMTGDKIRYTSFGSEYHAIMRVFFYESTDIITVHFCKK